jgi:Xaa-Pro aminopeptidase
MVEGLRAVKDAEEIERIAAAASLVDGIFDWLLERGFAGRREQAVARDLEYEMRSRGASGPSFASIVASGPHGALPHAHPRDVAIEPGTLVIVDIGAVLDGYCSDCTRTFAVGEPTGEAREVYELVLEAQVTGLQALAPGVSGQAVDAQAREVIERAGFGERFGHGLGHGVGLEIHEAPRLSRHSSEAELVAGNVVTVEPGVYLPGKLGVRIEDLVVVEPNGARRLSHFTKDLLVVD